MPSAHTPASVHGRLARRDFLAASTALLAPGGMPAAAAGRGDATIRIGLIGCGGRGTGAAVQAAAADPAVRIVALGDAFADQLASAAAVLGRAAASQFDCPPARRHVGPEAHRRVLAEGLDAVLIAAPPHLRPPHVEAAVAARVHVMCETPAGVDARGVIRVAEAFARGRAAGLSIASGLHGRRDERLSAAVARVHAGAIGRPVAVDVHAVNGRGWRVPVRPEWTAAEARLRNWIGSDALSGGPFVERHVHAIDRALWALGDRLPSAARPLPGRAGVAIGYVFDDGAEIRVSSLPCPEPGVVGGETVSGSRGSSRLELAADGRRFQATIDAFLQSIRSGRAMDDSGTLVRASLVAVMGRTAAEAGRTLGWGEVAGGDAPALALSSPVHQIGRSVNPAGA